jgi:hypothetical protein
MCLLMNAKRKHGIWRPPKNAKRIRETKEAVDASDSPSEGHEKYTRWRKLRPYVKRRLLLRHVAAMRPEDCMG